MRTDRVLNAEVFRFGWGLPPIPKLPYRSKLAGPALTRAVREVVRDDRIRLREELILERVPLVREISEIMSRSFPQAAFGEVVRAGIAGLSEAVNTFDPDRHRSFSAFARQRIRAAILEKMARLETDGQASRENRVKHGARSAKAAFPNTGIVSALDLVRDRLPHDYRKAAELYYRDEFTDREVASALGITVNKASKLRSAVIEEIAFLLATSGK